MTFVMDAWSANKQAGAQKDASKKSIAEQQRQFDLTRSDMMPWMTAGKGALADMTALNSGDYSKFYKDPSYDFVLNEGMKFGDRTAASRGRLYSGGYGQDLTKYAQGLAGTQYDNYYGRLAGLAGVGQNATQTIGAFGQNKANQISNQYGNIGNARASAYQGYGNAFNKAVDQFGNFIGGMG